MCSLRRYALLVVVTMGTPLAAIACRTDTKPPIPSGGASPEAPSDAAGTKATGSGITKTASVASVASVDTPTEALVPAAGDPAAAKAPQPLSSAACRALLAQTDAAFAAAFRRVQRTCSDDAGCVQEPPNCRPGCGGTAFSASDKAKLVDATKAPRADCERFYEGQCIGTLAMPVPSCPRIEPVCEKGTCVAKAIFKPKGTK